MEYGFEAFIDESGDPGCSGPFRTNSDGGGQSNFLTLAAYVVRRETTAVLVKWRDEIRNEIKPNAKKRDIHFCKLSHHQRLRYCQLLAQKPARIIAVVINKAHLTERAKFENNCKQLYWYACRLLVERISWLCDDHETTKDRKRVRLTFSNRGGTPHTEFQGYLRNLREVSTQIRWQCIDEELVSAAPHSQLAGLQFADCVASAITEGLEPGTFGFTEPRYGLELASLLYRYKKRRVRSYGLKVLPNPPTGLTKEQSAYIEALCK